MLLSSPVSQVVLYGSVGLRVYFTIKIMIMIGVLMIVLSIYYLKGLGLIVTYYSLYVIFLL